MSREPLSKAATISCAAATGLVIAYQLWLSYAMFRHRRAVPRLADVAHPPADIPLPRLSVIIPARNEEAALPRTVKSLLEQDYSELELVLVDDRSTDGTQVIIAQAADNYPDRVRAISVQELPPGWLGQNYALRLGAQEASGDWLLFTDADVLFHPECCRTAVAHAEAQRLDHLTLMPRITAWGVLVECLYVSRVSGVCSSAEIVSG